MGPVTVNVIGKETETISCVRDAWARTNKDGLLQCEKKSNVALLNARRKKPVSEQQEETLGIQ